MKSSKILKIAAGADFHFDRFEISSRDFSGVDQAGFLLIAGDFTHNGRLRELESFIQAIENVSIPIYLVFGNHDYHDDNLSALRQRLSDLGNLTILDGNHVVQQVDGMRVGLVGVKGHAGGFPPYRIAKHGEACAKLFMEEQEQELLKLKEGLEQLEQQKPDITIVLMHYLPFAEALGDEPRELYILLGASKFGDLVKKYKVDLVVFGHAHNGAEGLITIGNGPVIFNAGYHVNQKRLSLLEYDSVQQQFSLKYS